MIQPDYYKILQIDPDAEPDIIKAVYRRLSLKYHPDGSHPDPARMAMINEAYEVISDVVKRARYDDFRRRGVDFPRSARPPHSRTETANSTANVPPDFTYQPRVRRWRSYRAPGPSLSVVFGSMIVCAFIAVMLLGGASADSAARGRLASTAVPLRTPTLLALQAVDAIALRDGLLERGFQFQPVTVGDDVSVYNGEDQVNRVVVSITTSTQSIQSMQIAYARGSEITEDILDAQLAHQYFLLSQLFPNSTDRQTAAQWIARQEEQDIENTEALIGGWLIHVVHNDSLNTLTVTLDSNF